MPRGLVGANLKQLFNIDNKKLQSMIQQKNVVIAVGSKHGVYSGGEPNSLGSIVVFLYFTGFCTGYRP